MAASLGRYWWAANMISVGFNLDPGIRNPTGYLTKNPTGTLDGTETETWNLTWNPTGKAIENLPGKLTGKPIQNPNENLTFPSVLTQFCC